MKYLLLLLLISAPAHAMKFSVVGAVNMSEPKVAGMNYNATNAYGYGALMEFGLLPFFGMEIGALSLPRTYEYNHAVPVLGTTEVKMKMLEVPVVFKAYLGNLISLGIGGYWAKYKGHITYEQTTSTGVKSTSTQTLNQANHTNTDYGLVTSLGLYLPLAPLVSVIIDGRYTIGVKDNNTGSGTTNYNDMQLLGGLRLSF